MPELRAKLVVEIGKVLLLEGVPLRQRHVVAFGREACEVGDPVADRRASDVDATRDPVRPRVDRRMGETGSGGVPRGVGRRFGSAWYSAATRNMPGGTVVVVSDSGMKGRVKGLLGTPPEGDPAAPPEVPPQTSAQHEALQVLTLAQRTAEEHLNSARRETERVYGEARERAGQIVQEAQARAEALRRQAEAALSEAHAAAAQVASDAQARADEAQQEAEEILADARRRADELEKLAQAKADELQDLAQQRYEDVVGNLAAKREALQQQIEALERFDREYRARLQGFMQGQLRALWVDEPKVDPEDLDPAQSPPSTSAPVLRDDADQRPSATTPESKPAIPHP